MKKQKNQHWIKQDIEVRGAREHNLKSVDLTLPRGKMICFTGVSGSGKSSLAFDTLYAEGQRRYIESLSSYARQFVGQLPKPNVDFVGGLSPAISISQKSTSSNPRSTVGTITEIQDFLRVLFARVGTGFCPTCDVEIKSQTRDQITARLIEWAQSQERFAILAPIIRGQKGEHRDLFEELRKQGFTRARINGTIESLAEPPSLERQLRHSIEVVVDRIQSGSLNRTRLADAVDSALRMGEGTMLVCPLDTEGQAVDSATNSTDGEAISRQRVAPKKRRRKANIAESDLVYSAEYSCPSCGNGFVPPSPQLLSFNSPQGMCKQCDGLGQKYTFDLDLLIPNPKKSLRNGALELVGKWSQMSRWLRRQLQGVADTIESNNNLDAGFLLKTPWRDLPEKYQRLWLYGAGAERIHYKIRKGRRYVPVSGKFEGLIPQLLAHWNATKSPISRRYYEKYMHTVTCTQCHGARLNDQARHVRLKTNAKSFKTQPWASLSDVCELPLADCEEFFSDLDLNALQWQIAGEALKEICGRIGFLLEVGLSYLSLSRTAPTLSGGESQRIRLASQIGAGLVGVLYVLDEPSIGLHPRDNESLLTSLERLRDLGNTLIVVEHDEDTMRRSDLIVDFGPGPGVRGGELMTAGTMSQLQRNRRSVTGGFLSGRLKMDAPSERRQGNGHVLKVLQAQQNNLKGVDVDFPLGSFICVTGVSGSGKSSLVNEILAKALRRDLNGAECEPGPHAGIEGLEHLDKIVSIDQSPIGRTPRSNPATYVKVFDLIRDMFAQLPDAKKRGFAPGRFSFNTEHGRCSACEGNGANKLEMEFLADVWVECPVCQGARFDRETLQVKFKEHSIADVLNLDIQQALELFSNIPKIAEKLQTLHDVGLDYLKLGQPSPTLSGGEAQRIKLARELSRRSTGKTIYILDEPTTGLHFADINLLLGVLQKLVDLGNTVLVVEHNLDLIQAADWVIDLGPEGGQAGGQIVAAGTPEKISQAKRSHTGKSLKSYFAARHPPKTSAVNDRKKTPGGHSASTHRAITIEGASQHNLKSVNVTVPLGQMSVFCGHSGSGKTSLAMDTVYAEGQRRYVESLSAYARQFIGQMLKPSVEKIEGLSPAIAIEQRNLGHTPRSTVGTVTEIYDYLRVLMARVAQMYCPHCDIPIGTQTTDQIVSSLLEIPAKTKVLILAPYDFDFQTDFESLLDLWQASGFIRVRLDGKTYSIDSEATRGDLLNAWDRGRQQKVQVVIDRAVIASSQRGRLAEAVELAVSIGRGRVEVAIVDPTKDEPDWSGQMHSQWIACSNCYESFDALTPHSFSFNSYLGWCSDCEGIGEQVGTNPAAFIDPTKSLRQGGLLMLAPKEKEPDKSPSKLGESDSEYESLRTGIVTALAERIGVDADAPIGELPASKRRLLLYGANDLVLHVKTPTEMHLKYRGVFPTIEAASKFSPSLRIRLEGFVTEVECNTCHGSRVRDEARAARFLNTTIVDLTTMSLGRLLDTIKTWKLDARETQIVGEIVLEIRSRLEFLVDVGLEYLTLSRSANSLSGGESQRIRLASQLGNRLCGVLYVLDEPTIGLHPRDNHRLVQAMHKLRDAGNTLLVVEHDRDVIASADQIFDFGPGSGQLGGEILLQESPAALVTARDGRRSNSIKNLSTQKSAPKRTSKVYKEVIARSVTAPYLSGEKFLPIPKERRPVPFQQTSHGPEIATQCLQIRNARHNTLRGIDVAIPLGRLVAVTGPSGSGKSSLINDILYPSLARRLHRASVKVGAHDRIENANSVHKVVQVDQSPLGMSPSSNPVTYTGAFDLIRQLYANLPESKVRGFTPRHFSFNVPGGRCEKCEGNGQCKIEMHFLPDVWVPCDACEGRRYSDETLAVKYHNHSISDLLRLPIGKAFDLFEETPKIRRILKTLVDVGLDYLQVGQSAPTLSGGEAQRVKLAAELARPQSGNTLYLLDEPTTGLHFDDIQKLVDVVHRLVDLGNTVVVIEHNLEVIAQADWVIDMGPDAGWHGGRIVASGTPEMIVEYAKSRDVPQTKSSAKRRTSQDTTQKRNDGTATSPSYGSFRSHTGEALARTLNPDHYQARATYDPKSDLQRAKSRSVPNATQPQASQLQASQPRESAVTRSSSESTSNSEKDEPKDTKRAEVELTKHPLFDAMIGKVQRTAGGQESPSHEHLVRSMNNDDAWLRIDRADAESLWLHLNSHPNLLPKWALKEFRGRIEMIPKSTDSMTLLVRFSSRAEIRSAKLTKLLKHYRTVNRAKTQ